MFNPEIQYYSANIKNTRPRGRVSLLRIFNAIRHPKPKYIEIFNQIHKAAETGDEARKSLLKEKYLVFFTPSVLVHDRRRYADIEAFTGLAVLDFDKIDNADELRDYIFYEYPQCIGAWLSSSKRGTRALFRIPIVDTVDRFKSYFYGLFKEFEGFDGIDLAPQNAVLPLFYSVDTGLKFRENSKIWSVKGPNPKPQNYHPSNNYISVEPSSRTEARVLAMARSGINKIQDNGHPQLRGLCVALGGYVASGYIQESVLISELDYLIANNSYLSKGVPGYQKTARSAVNVGKGKPLRLD